MKSAEEIKLKKAYLEGLVEGMQNYSISDAEVFRAQIKILDWVLNETVSPVNIKCEVTNDI